MNRNISNIQNCYGCGVCATVCAKQIIKIDLNNDGFYEPHITDITKCTNCGLCTEVCSFTHNEVAGNPIEIKAYAAWSKAFPVRHKCSSGGVGFEIGRNLIKKGYKVCAVRYNAKKNITEHYIAATPEELIPSMGSKYIQSYTLNAFKAINRKEKHLVIGTPCQIDSFRRYINKFRVEDNFILMDFFCHGVPSYLIWKAYSKKVENIIGKIGNVVWRHKFSGWHDSYAMSIDEENNKNVATESNINIVYNLKIEETKGQYFSKMTDGDDFYTLFFGNNCLGKACYKNCKYKYLSSSADIRIGDLWGNEYKDNKEGVSSLIVFTQKGKDLIEDIDSIEKVEHHIDVVAEGQMQHKIKYPSIARPIILLMAKIGFNVGTLSFMSKVSNKLRRLLK